MELNASSLADAALGHASFVRLDALDFDGAAFNAVPMNGIGAVQGGGGGGGGGGPLSRLRRIYEGY